MSGFSRQKKYVAESMYTHIQSTPSQGIEFGGRFFYAFHSPQSQVTGRPVHPTDPSKLSASYEEVMKWIPNGYNPLIDNLLSSGWDTTKIEMMSYSIINLYKTAPVFPHQEYIVY